MKHLKIGRHELVALTIIACATLLRLVLIGLGWPFTNSDEATMGLMARHIAYTGERPVFFYGQNYMGAFEAYVGAASFHLFGPSIFSLRLGLVLMFCLFLLTMYLLTRLLYSNVWALAVLILLSFGSSFVMARELTAIGGYAETLLFGSLAFLLASWLVLSYRPNLPLRTQSWRFSGYGCWGIVVGLGLWSDLLLAPFALLSGVMLLLFCWRELLQTLTGLCVLFGLAIGAFPLISYNLSATSEQDSWTVLWQLHNGDGTVHANLLRELLGTIRISLPLMTGNPFCTTTERVLYGPSSSLSPCMLAGSSWGIGYLLLFAFALVLATRAVLKSHHVKKDKRGVLERQTRIRQSARFLLLSSAGLTLALYSVSYAATDWTGSHARYLIGLFIATPAIFWPLWLGSTMTAKSMAGLLKVRKYFCVTILVLIPSVFLVGSSLTFGQVAATQVENRQQQDMINHLSSLGVTHVYTDYWTCDRLAFVSGEKITCAVIENNLRVSSLYNRYAPYLSVVRTDPRACYLLPVTMDELVPKETLTPYQRFVFDGYVLYQRSEAVA
ncbi:MAG: hypothetical protein NVS4B11_18450 [Ktedonobacteraceae bacterium]